MMSMMSMDCWDDFEDQLDDHQFLTFRNTLSVAKKNKDKKFNGYQSRKTKVNSNLSEKRPEIIVKKLNFSPVLQRTAGA